MKFIHPGMEVGTELLFCDPARSSPYTLRRAVIAQKSTASLGYHLLVYNDPEIDCRHGRPSTEIAYDVEIIANEAAFPHPNARVAWPKYAWPTELHDFRSDAPKLPPMPDDIRAKGKMVIAAPSDPATPQPTEPTNYSKITTFGEAPPQPNKLEIPDLHEEFNRGLLEATEDVVEKVPAILMGSRGFCMVAARNGAATKFLQEFGSADGGEFEWTSKVENAAIFADVKSSRSAINSSTQPFIDKIEVVKRGRGRPRKKA